MLAEQRRSGDCRRELGEFDGAPDGQVLAALLVVDLDHAAAGAQRGVVGDLLHAEDWRAGHLERAQDVDGLVLGLVGQPLLDVVEDLEDVR